MDSDPSNPIQAAGKNPVSGEGPERNAPIIESWLDNLVPATRRTYTESLREYAKWRIVVEDAGELDDDPVNLYAAAFLCLSQGEANRRTLEYQTALKERALAPSTVNLRIQALRALCKVGRLMGLISWNIEVPQLRSRPYRDTRGPGDEGVNALLDAARKRKGPAATRDVAMVSMLFTMGLRATELVSLDFKDLELEERRIVLRGKGRLEPEYMTIPLKTLECLRVWLALRRELLASWGVGEEGPVFLSLHHGHRMGRLARNGLWWVLGKLGKMSGIGPVHPHGIRHTAVTKALELTGGNLLDVQKYGRWKDPKTVMVYNDNREDVGGRISGQLDGLLPAGEDKIDG